MQKFEKIFHNLYKSHIVFNLISIPLRPFTNEKSIDILINEKVFQKYLDEDQNNTEHHLKKSIILNNSENIIEKYTDKFKNNAKNKSFTNLLRNSNLIQLGDPERKIVTGKIFQIVKNDLYIDFGWKFHCVCSKPIKNNSQYIRGSLVHLQIKSLELSTKFLGSNSDTTILEADCILLGLVNNPHSIQNK